jgi:hypothetical protein
MLTEKDGELDPVDSETESELNDYHVELVRNGVRQADAGELTDHADVERLVRQLRLRN